MTLQFNSDIDECPVKTGVLVIYTKGNKTFNGKKGTFVTQAQRTNKGSLDYFDDYTGRLICDRNARTSKNKILGWIKIEEVIYEETI